GIRDATVTGVQTCALPISREEVRVLGKQLLRSGTSVAAHAREASRARSDSEFCSKLDGLLQEADESQLWLELLQEDCGIAGQPKIGRASCRERVGMWEVSE